MMPQHAQTPPPIRPFGSDVAKGQLDIHCPDEKRSWHITNTAEAIRAFIRAHRRGCGRQRGRRRLGP